MASEGKDAGRTSERRAARRFGARHAARLQFVTTLADARGFGGAELWPTLICQTRDISSSGLALHVPALREGDDHFFGVEGPVRVTLGLPIGAVEAWAVAARYEWDINGEPRGFLVCVKLTDMDGGSAGRLNVHLRSLG